MPQQHPTVPPSLTTQQDPCDVHDLLSTDLTVSYLGRFKHILWTSHRQKLGEMRGKASNVDWAAREAAKEFKRLGEYPSFLCHICMCKYRRHFI